MSFAEILPAVHALPRVDKLRLLQVLADDIAQVEGLAVFQPGVAYPLLTPYTGHDAAVALQKMLDEEKEKSV